MHISAATWQRLSQLLDEALDLDVEARAAWMTGLAQTEPDLEPIIRKLLAAHAAGGTADVLLSVPQAPPAAAFEVGDRVGPYRLKRELGSGGMADVWLAERADGAFVRDVALKLPRASRFRRDLHARFRRERDILARLTHPHIARFYDAGVTHDGLAYMAMEYIDGRPVTAWCDEQRLDVRSRLALFAQVLDAVQYAHANLVIHRDLKPSNILVTADGNAHLLDFGIAKLLAEENAQETELTQLSGRALTPEYASPEQITGAPLTTASDIYSLGVVLYELVCGARPYRLKVASAAQLEQAILATDPAKPSVVITDEAAAARKTRCRNLERQLAGDIDTVVLKALAKAPAARYATAAEFGADIERYLSGQPVQAHPASWRHRAWKFASRNRLPLTSATAIAVTLMTATGVSLWEAQTARQQAARADEVKEFVLSLLEAGAIDAGANRKTTAVELLEKARDRLKTARVSDPAARVEVLTTVGIGLQGYGARKEATEVFGEAARLSAEQLGETARDTGIARSLYGRFLARAGNEQAAEAQFDAAELALRREPNRRWLAQLLRFKADLRAQQGDLDRAVELAQQSVQVANEHPDHKEILVDSYNDLSELLIRSRRKGALDAASHAYEIAVELSGGHPTAQLLSTRSTRAEALAKENGDMLAALGELRTVLQQQEDLFGSRGAYRTLSRIASLAVAAGEPSAAIDAYQRLLPQSIAADDGKPGRGTALLHLHLADAYANAHRYEQARYEWNEADGALTAIAGIDDVDARLARSGVAFALTRLGRIDAADPIFAALLTRPFTQPTERLLIESRLAALRSVQGHHDEAEAILAGIAQSPDGSSQRLHALALAELGYARVAAGRFSQAFEVLQQGRDLLSSQQPNGSPDLADIDVHIARAKLALGALGEALAAAQRAVDYWQRVDPRNREHAVALLWQSRVLAANHDAAGAKQSLGASADIFATAALPGDDAMIKSARALVASAHHSPH